MSNTAQTPHTNIEINASNKDVVRILAAQYAHMDQAAARATLAKTHNPVWTNEELLDLFEVSHFDPPYAHVIRKIDGVRGTVAFIDTPRLYFAFHTEEPNDAGTA